MSLHTKEIYEFADFRLDVAERKLVRDGKVLPITDKAFDTLCVLVRRSGGLVSKDELMASVWPDTVVEENNLDQKISFLRRSLSVRGRTKQPVIETVRGRGYRFLPDVVRVPDDAPRLDAVPLATTTSRPTRAVPSLLRTERSGNVVAVAAWQPKVEPEDQSTSSAPSQSEGHPLEMPEPSAMRSSRVTWIRAALVAVALVTLGYLAWTLIAPASQNVTSSPAPIESIAVLPFANQTGAAENDFLVEVLTEAVIGSLSDFRYVSVKPRSSVLRYKGLDVPPEKVAEELSVQGMVTGVVTRRGEEFSVSLELVDLRTGNAIWSKRYTRREPDMIGLQSEIASDVANKLRDRLSTADQQRVIRANSADPEANRYYWQGIYFLNKRTAEDIRRSLEEFQRATIEDPSYARAYAATSLAHIILPDYSSRMTRDEVKRAEQNFREAFLRARELDETLPEVHVLAAINCELDWNVPCALESYRRAIELDPNLALARHVSSRLLGATGKSDEALDNINKARELDPFSRSIAFNVGARLADARRYDDAIQQYKRVLEMEPSHPLSHLGLAIAYEAKGLYRDAIAEFRTAWVLLEKYGDAEAQAKASELSRSLEANGPQGYWQKRLEHAEVEYKAGTGQKFRIAVCLARLGRVDQALEELERSWADREPDLLWIRADQAFDSMNTDPRFQDLLRRIGVKD